MNTYVSGAGAGGELTKMHLAARLKTHTLHRVMERVPGLCPGVVLRAIDAADDPLVVGDNEAIYRVTLPDGRRIVAVTKPLERVTITVMTTPCEAFVGQRLYRVTDTSIERIKNVNNPFRNDPGGFKRRKQKARQRFLRNPR